MKQFNNVDVNKYIMFNTVITGKQTLLRVMRCWQTILHSCLAHCRENVASCLAVFELEFYWCNANSLMTFTLLVFI